MTTKDLLIAARARIADEQHWTQGENARDATGRAVEARDPSAVSWCAWGAVVASEPAHSALLWEAAAALRRGICHDWDIISDYNDRVTHRSILRLFTRAIKAQPEAGA